MRVQKIDSTAYQNSGKNIAFGNITGKIITELFTENAERAGKRFKPLAEVKSTINSFFNQEGLNFSKIDEVAGVDVHFSHDMSTVSAKVLPHENPGDIYTPITISFPIFNDGKEFFETIFRTINYWKSIIKS